MNISNNTYVLLALFLGQIMLFNLGTVTLQYYRILEGVIVPFIIIFIVFNYFIAIIIIPKLFKADSQAVVIQKQESSLQKLESKIRSIRSQRHDIVNHLHTIYALLQMGKDQRAKSYVSEVGSITAGYSHAIRLEEPEVAAFLQSKLGQALAKDISLNIEILTDIRNCAIKPYFWVIILGNLLDNAFEAVEDLPVSERHVELEIFQHENFYQCTVSNTGPSIEEDFQEKIFELGYSTKEPGRGHGLSLVREAVQNHGGNISIINYPTTFIVSLPKKEERGDANDSSIGSKIS